MLKKRNKSMFKHTFHIKTQILPRDPNFYKKVLKNRGRFLINIIDVFYTIFTWF